MIMRPCSDTSILRRIWPRSKGVLNLRSATALVGSRRIFHKGNLITIPAYALIAGVGDMHASVMRAKILSVQIYFLGRDGIKFWIAVTITGVRARYAAVRPNRSDMKS